MKIIKTKGFSNWYQFHNNRQVFCWRWHLNYSIVLPMPSRVQMVSNPFPSIKCGFPYISPSIKFEGW